MKSLFKTGPYWKSTSVLATLASSAILSSVKKFHNQRKKWKYFPNKGLPFGSSALYLTRLGAF